MAGESMYCGFSELMSSSIIVAGSSCSLLSVVWSSVSNSLLLIACGLIGSVCFSGGVFGDALLTVVARRLKKL